MWCPKCYGKLDKKQGVCFHCGFKMKNFEGATNSDVKIARANGKKEDILYTNILPPDVSRRKLLLYSIFLGLIGGHNYYVGRFGKAIFATIAFCLAVLFTILQKANIATGFVNYFDTFVFLLQGIAVLIWLYDLICIIFKKYKVPVYKKEFSEKD